MSTVLTHTPGPWKTPGLDGGARVVSARVNGKSKTIAHVYSHISLDDDADEYNGQQECNARLVANAPEMMSLLREVAVKFEGYREQGMQTPIYLVRRINNILKPNARLDGQKDVTQ